MPTIQSVLAVPGWGTTLTLREAIPQARETVLVGLVVANQPVAWGECLAAADVPFAATTAVAFIEQTIAPALQGRPLEHFATLLDEVIHLSRAAAGSAALSLGLGQALLVAFSQVRQQPVATFLAESYQLPLPTTAVPLAFPVGNKPLPVTLARLQQAVTMVSYTLTNPQTQLGEKGELLQRYVRQLKEWLTRLDKSYRPLLFLNVRGGLGPLLNYNAGLVFGTLFGLVALAGPYKLAVADPVVLDSREAQIAEMRQLKEFTRRRGSSLRLVASAWVQSLADVEAWLAAEAAHVLCLDVVQFGYLSELMAAIRACQARGVAVLLRDGAGSNGRLTQLTTHIALATHPDWLMTTAVADGDMGLSLLHNEMARTLAEI